MKYLSDNYAYLLRTHGLNSRQLSDRLGGKPSQPTLSRLEKTPGKNPRLENIQIIADFFEVPIEDLMNKPLWMDSAQTQDITQKIQEPKTSYATAGKLPKKTIPLLEIDQAVKYVSQRSQVDIKHSERVATTMPHSDLAFAVRMFDNSMKAEENTEESISKGEILIVEPKIPPRHEDIVVVNLNPEKQIGMVAKLEIDPFGKRRLRRTGINVAGENLIDLPEGAFICGVVIEIKRRTISFSEVEKRIKNEYNPIESTQK